METIHGCDYLNDIEEVACALSYKELIETPIWPEDIRTTPVANIKKEAELPGSRDVRPITLAATLCCAWPSTRYREAMTWARKSMAPQNCARRNTRFQSEECHLATTVEGGVHDKG